jgi:addiction module RelE/StbE family toxin
MAVRVVYGERFRRAARRLPTTKQEKLADLLALLQQNPFHPKLHTKPLAGQLAGLYAFRITRDWRAIFRFLAPDTVMLLTVGHRKDIYR